MSDSHRRNRVISNANVYIVGSLDPMSNLVLIACASDSSYSAAVNWQNDTKHNVLETTLSLYSKSSEAIWDSFGWWNLFIDVSI